MTLCTTHSPSYSLHPPLNPQANQEYPIRNRERRCVAVAFLEDSEGLDVAVVAVLSVAVLLVLGVVLAAAVVTPEVALSYLQEFEY